MHQQRASVCGGLIQGARSAVLCIALLMIILINCGTKDDPESELRDWEHLSNIQVLHKADSLFEERETDKGFRLVTMVAERRAKEVSAPDSILAEALVMMGQYHSSANRNYPALFYYHHALPQLYSLYGEDNWRYMQLLHTMAANTYIKGIEENSDEFKAEAERLHWKAHRLCVETYGDSSVHTISSIADLGSHYFGDQQFERADSLYRDALELADSILSRNDPARAGILRNLGYVNRHRCRYLKAEEYLLELLDIADSVPDFEPRSIVDVYAGLSYMYGAEARYAEADSCFEKAKQIYKDHEIPENRDLSILYKNQGNMLMDQCRYEEADSIYWLAYEIRKRVEGIDSVHLAETLVNIGSLYILMGRYDEAEVHLRRSLRLRTDLLGAGHTFNVYPLLGLGDLFTVLAEYDTADVYYDSALGICLDRYDKDHLHAGWCYRGLADTRRFRGMYVEAESLYELALAIEENTLGSENAEVAEILLSYAHLYGSTGECGKALVAYDRMLRSRYEFIASQFFGSTRDQKRRFVDIHPLIINSLLSLAQADSSKESRTAALEMVLKGKAIILEASAKEDSIAWCSGDKELLAMAKLWQDVLSLISELFITRWNAGDIGDIVDRLDSLTAVRDSLEYALSVQCSEAAMELQERGFTLSDVANALGKNQVLCEIVRYEPYDFSAIGCDTCRTGQPRYISLVLNHSGQVSICDLGDAAEIDSLVTLTRKMIYDVGEGFDLFSEKHGVLEADLRQVTSKLRDLVFTPMESELVGCTELFISPDGALNLLPFEILPVSEDSFLVEEYSISYLSTGRDLLKHDDELTCSDTAILVASPDYDSTAVASASRRKGSIFAIQFASLGSVASRGLSECLTEWFYDLPSGRDEVGMIGKLLKANTDLTVRTYLGPDAREEVIKHAYRPYLIHLSTHGFFCEDVDATSVYTMDDPLQRSGVALTGINHTIRNPGLSTAGNDGILMALEVSGSFYGGTELVVLSACETGVGEVKNSEGVLGLRWAFQHAGVRSLIMSLWKVPDIETAKLMRGFYELWLADGFSRKEALRGSVLRLLEEYRANNLPTHPAIWGAFVYAGDPD